MRLNQHIIETVIVEDGNMSKVIVAPVRFEMHEAWGANKLFLAGGITNCPNWQNEMIEKLKETNIIIFNPRRESYPINEDSTSLKQIKWEYDYLKSADIISYWFSEGSINPISLYELGMWGNSRDKKIFIGVHPDYQRKEDVYIQTRLARPDIKIVDSIDKLCKQIIKYNGKKD